MTRTTLLAAATATLLLLAGCGSGSDPDSGPSATAEAPATTAQPATTEEPPATEDETETTPAPATTRTPAAPTGKLLDYETGDDEGVVLSTAADAAKLTGAPADFTSFITAELASATPGEGCTEAPQIYVSRVDTGGWARGGYFIPQCGGYATLWAKTGGGWKDVWSGQSLVECATLEQFKIPARIAGGSCLQGDETVTYAG
jgi:hypothetical protein